MHGVLSQAACAQLHGTTATWRYHGHAMPRVMPLVLSRESQEVMEGSLGAPAGCTTGGADHIRSNPEQPLSVVLMDAAPVSTAHATAAVASSRPREHPERAST